MNLFLPGKKARFYSCFARSVKAGLSLSRSLENSMELAPERGWRYVQRSLDQGQDPADILSKSREIPEFDRRLLTAAGQSGDWAVFLEMLASYYEQKQEFINVTVKEAAYPVFLLHAFIFLPNVSVWFLNGFFAYLMVILPWIIGTYGGAWLIYRLFLLKGFYYFYQIPFAGKMLQSGNLGFFLQISGLFLNAGLGFHQILDIAQNPHDPDTSSKIKDLRNAVDSGSSFSEGLKKAGFPFSKIVFASLSSSEISGCLPECMIREGKVLVENYHSLFRIIGRAMGIALYLGIAVMVALRAISTFTGF